ncbi:hypothetical protein D3C85_1074250 [compost metagenome]
MLIKHLCIIAGIFLGCKGIHIAANRIELFRDILSVIAIRSLEQHMFNEMRYPVDLKTLITGSGLNPNAK